MRHAVYAGLCLLALGNVHTYDESPFGCVWTAYLVVRRHCEPSPARGVIGLSAVVAARRFHRSVTSGACTSWMSFHGRGRTLRPLAGDLLDSRGYGWCLHGRCSAPVIAARSEGREGRPRSDWSNSRLFHSICVGGGGVCRSLYSPLASSASSLWGFTSPVAFSGALAVNEGHPMAAHSGDE